MKPENQIEPDKLRGKRLTVVRAQMSEQGECFGLWARMDDNDIEISTGFDGQLLFTKGKPWWA